MEAIYLACGAGGPQLKRNPLGGWSATLRTSSRLAQLLLTIALLIPVRAAAQAAPPLTQADFVLGGLTRGMDSAVVRQRLGKPDSVSTDPHPFDVGAQLVAWHYLGLTVEFFATNHVVGISTRDPRTPTTRGLRVGDLVATMLRLYGAPTDSAANDYDYEKADDPHLILRVTTRKGRVVEIYFGAIID